MSDDTVISVEGLSKRYWLGHMPRHDTLRDALSHTFKSLPRLLRQSVTRSGPTNRDELWALRDVTFEVKRGEVVGIIGRNGAGKSTLLKILSRITEPTTGRVTLRGRVASLLEVGTGFHPELTGRDNVFLNGAILGMSRTEIRRKFDEIVAFAEVEKFLDTPVKHYSSGMYVRLAFAVAAHLEPEILIVDEVLAVGDAAFQKKCLWKMQDVSVNEGRTVLFVSHNMPAVQALCSRAILLQDGAITAAGEVEPLIDQYLTTATQMERQVRAGPVPLGATIKLLNIELPSNPTKSGEPLRFALEFRAESSTCINALAVLFYSAQDTRIAIMDFRPFGLPVNLAVGQRWRTTCEIKSLPFIEGDYSIGLYAHTTDFVGNLYNLAQLVVRARSDHSGMVPYPACYRGVMELNFTAAFHAFPSNDHP